MTIGDQLGGFRIIAPIGQGGMGSVYLAEDESLSRRVALKVILPELSREVGFRRRFEDEARSAAAIDHPNVVPIYSAGAADGRLYLAMRYVQGTDLEARLRAAPGGTVEPSEAVALLTEVASALDAAHRRGLVHRDVKPANVLLGSEGDQVLLTDFGLSRHFGSSGGHTETGKLVASLDYAAPEQIRSGWVDARTDVYALGCVLYRMLSGTVPYPVPDAQKMWSIVEDPLPSLPGAGEAIDAVIAKATAKHPDDRYLSAGDLALAANRAVAGKAVPGAGRSVAAGPAATGVSDAYLDSVATRTLPDEVYLEGGPTIRRSRPQRRGGSRAAVIASIGAGAVVVAAGVVAAALIAAGGGEASRTVIRAPGPTVTEAAPAEPAARQVGGAATEGGTERVAGAAQPPLVPYEATAYRLAVPDLWEHDTVEERSEEGGFHTNIWREPADPESTYIRADGGNPVTVTEPVAVSEELVEQVREADGYREISYGPDLLAGREVARWVYELEGDRRIDFFFVECGRGLAVLGSTSPSRFPELAATFRTVAATARLDCVDE